MPLFRQELAGSMSGGAMDRWSIAIQMFRWGSLFELPLGDFLLFLPAGVFGVAALYEAGRGYRQAAVLVGLGAIPLFTFVEIAHGIRGGFGPTVHRCVAS